jgi:hypothetical protein
LKEAGILYYSVTSYFCSESKVDGRKAVVSSKYQKVVNKRRTDPEYDLQFKKQNAVRKAKCIAKKKDSSLEKSTSLTGKTNNSPTIKVNSETSESMHPLHPYKAYRKSALWMHFYRNSILHSLYVEPKTYCFRTTPTSVKLFQDLGEGDKFYHVIIGCGGEVVTVKHFMKG